MIEGSGLSVRWLNDAGPPRFGAEELIATARRTGATTFVTDLDQPAARDGLVALHRRLREHGRCVAIVADAPPLDADVVVVPYVGATAPPGAGARYLTGPDYFVLRPQLAALRERREGVREQADRVLVSLGGADPGGRTITVGQALVSLRRGLDIRIVLGPSFSDSQLSDLEALAARHGLATVPGSALAEGLIWCDLFITADGLSKYEAAALGTPTLVVQAPETRTALSGLFATAGTAAYVAGVPPTRAQIAEAVEALLDDAAARAQMSTRGPALVDGRGAQRICDALPL